MQAHNRTAEPQSQFVNGFEFTMGLLVGLPIPYPVLPIYPLAFLVCAIGIARSNPRVETWFFVTFTIISSAFAMVLSPGGAGGSVFLHARPYYLVAVFLFFLFGSGLRRFDSFAKGFVTTSAVIAFAIFGIFVSERIWRHGALLFVIPDLRMWGAAYFPDWPNFLAASLTVAALWAWFLLGWRSFAVVTMLGAILTTSRTALLGLLIALLVDVITRLKRPRAFVVAVVLVAVTGAWVFEYVSALPEAIYIRNRLLKSQDRELVVFAAVEIFKANPVTGIGPVALDESSGIPASSIHNSYLDILVRFGMLGFLPWLFLLRPPLGGDKRAFLAFGAAFLFFMVAALFNNIFKHPHLLLLFSAMLEAFHRRVGVRRVPLRNVGRVGRWPTAHKEIA